MKQRLTLRRAYLEICCIGKLSYEGDIICSTVEPPYMSNMKSVSAIPPGIYKIERHNSDDYPDTFALVNHNLGVYHHEDPKAIRDNILIHVFNFPHETKGCIGPGMGEHPSTWGVANSRDAMRMLNQLMDSEGWSIEII